MSKRIPILVVAAALALGASAAFATAGGASPDAVDLYGRIQAKLAADSAEGVAASAASLAAEIRGEAKGAADPAPFEAAAAAAAKLTGDDLAVLRDRFKEVSKTFAAYVEARGLQGLDLYYCPMVDAYWLQRSSDTPAHNPYYGKSMAKCGSKVEKIEN